MIKHHTIKKRYVTTLNSQGLHMNLTYSLVSYGPSKINVQIRKRTQKTRKEKFIAAAKKRKQTKPLRSKHSKKKSIFDGRPHAGICCLPQRKYTKKFHTQINRKNEKRKYTNDSQINCDNKTIAHVHHKMLDVRVCFHTKRYKQTNTHTRTKNKRRST